MKSPRAKSDRNTNAMNGGVIKERLIWAAAVYVPSSRCVIIAVELNKLKRGNVEFDA